jgi:hypothetical protein
MKENPLLADYVSVSKHIDIPCKMKQKLDEQSSTANENSTISVEQMISDSKETKGTSENTTPLLTPSPPLSPLSSPSQSKIDRSIPDSESKPLIPNMSTTENSPRKIETTDIISSLQSEGTENILATNRSLKSESEYFQCLLNVYLKNVKKREDRSLFRKLYHKALSANSPLPLNWFFERLVFHILTKVKDPKILEYTFNTLLDIDLTTTFSSEKEFIACFLVYSSPLIASLEQSVREACWKVLSLKEIYNFSKILCYSVQRKIVVVVFTFT